MRLVGDEELFGQAPFRQSAVRLDLKVIHRPDPFDLQHLAQRYPCLRRRSADDVEPEMLPRFKFAGFPGASVSRVELGIGIALGGFGGVDALEFDEFAF